VYEAAPISAIQAIAPGPVSNSRREAATVTTATPIAAYSAKRHRSPNAKISPRKLR
jgi:hypothetical protein